MGSRDPRVDRYIEQAAPFARPLLAQLRRVVHDAVPAVEETIKWGMPHFLKGGILCRMAAFKRHCAFDFWRPPARLAPPATKALGQLGRLVSVDDLPARATLRLLIRAAAARIVSPAPVRRPRRPAPRTPADLARALRGSKRAAATFAALPPSGRREYVEWLTGAKRPETRARRLRTAIDWLAAGKAFGWRYQAR